MDMNDLRTVVTVLSLVAFIGLMAWVSLRRNSQAFDEAADLPFADNFADNRSEDRS
jgi:cytochrome c oxidase cbb3-type subunit 4